MNADNVGLTPLLFAINLGRKSPWKAGRSVFGKPVATSNCIHDKNSIALSPPIEVKSTQQLNNAPRSGVLTTYPGRLPLP